MGENLLNSTPFIGVPVPSVLTGNFLPYKASTSAGKTMSDVNVRGLRLSTPVLSLSPLQIPPLQIYPQTKGKVEEVSALCHMASRHLGHLRQAGPPPYTPHHPPPPVRCLSTPPLRTPTGSSQFALLPQPRTPPQLLPPQPLLVPSSESPLQDAPVLAAATTATVNEASVSPDLPAEATVVASTAAAAAGVGGCFMTLPTDGSHLHHGPVSSCSPHPLFAAHQLSPQQRILPRHVLVPLPSSPPGLEETPKASPIVISGGAPPGFIQPAGNAGRVLPSAPMVTAPHQQPAQVQALAAAPGLSNITSPLPSPPPLARASRHLLPAASRPTTSMSIQDLNLSRPGPRISSRSLTHGSLSHFLDASRSASAGSGGVFAGPGVVASTSATSTTFPPGAAAVMQSSPAVHGYGEAVVGGVRSGGHSGSHSSSGPAGTSLPSPRCAANRFHHTATRWASEAAHPVGFKVTRGMMYSVFQELDEFDSGQLTYSAFEQAACKVGMRPVQAVRFFARLDPEERGYATIRDWSSPSLQREMEAFTRLYVQATRGSDGRPKDITEVRSMHMAIQMAMVKLQLKRCGRAVSLDRLVQAFAFMDRDSNGQLNAEEVEDALNSLRIFVTKDVVDAIMRCFDKDGDGTVDYFEFVKSLYPTLDTSVYRH